MGDVGDDFRALRELRAYRRNVNLREARTEGFTKHTDYHYSRMLLGSRLDYWPSRNKFQWRGKVMVGDVHGFIKNREKEHERATQNNSK